MWNEFIISIESVLGSHFGRAEEDEQISPLQQTKEDSPDPCWPRRDGGGEGLRVG